MLELLNQIDTFVYGHNSGESLKWAPKVHGWQHPYLSGQWTENSCIYGLFVISSLTSTRVLSDTLVFYLLKNKMEREFNNAGIIESN